MGIAEPKPGLKMGLAEMALTPVPVGANRAQLRVRSCSCRFSPLRLRVEALHLISQASLGSMAMHGAVLIEVNHDIHCLTCFQLLLQLFRRRQVLLPGMQRLAAFEAAREGGAVPMAAAQRFIDQSFPFSARR